MQKKKIVEVLLVLVMMLGMLAGCGQSSGEEVKSTTPPSQGEAAGTEQTNPAPQETVNIVWHRYHWSVNADEKLVEQAINEYIEPLIGVTVTVINKAEGTPLDTALAAGDDIDIFQCQGAITNYVNQKAVYDLTDLLPNYPGLVNSMPEIAWEASLINGRAYFIPNYKEMATASSVVIPTSMVEKYNIDVESIKTYSDLEPWLKIMKDDGVELPVILQKEGYQTLGREDFSFFNRFVGVRRDDPTKVVSINETDEYKEFVEMIHRWNELGYISQQEQVENGLGMTEYVARFATDDAGFYMLYEMVPDAAANASNRHGADMTVIQVSESRIETTATRGSSYSINANTKKVDACLKFLELLNTDQKLLDLAVYGIEGKHYTRNEAGEVVKIPKSGYSYPGLWAVGNVQVASILEGENPEKGKLYNEFNEAASFSETFGFQFDELPVELEMSAIKAVTLEYQHLLELGFYDPAEKLPEYISALKAAGIDKVVEECQRQYDTWLANK